MTNAIEAVVMTAKSIPPASSSGDDMYMHMGSGIRFPIEILQLDARSKCKDRCIQSLKLGDLPILHGSVLDGMLSEE